MTEKISDSSGQIMVRIQQPGATRHDAVAVVIGITGEGNVELILEADQPRHGVRRRTVHADFTIPVESHETKGGINGGIYDSKRKAITLADAAPISQSRTAQRINSNFEICGADGLYINNGAEIIHVPGHVIMAMGRWSFNGLLVKRPPHFAKALFKQL